MPPRVAVVAQADYASPSLEDALRRAIDLAGFDLACVRGKRVLLKPNMLGAYPPSMGITTHPSFVAAAVRIFRDAGATVLVSDSPNGIYPIDRVWEVTGLREVCRASGAKEIHFEASGNVSRGGVQIARAAAEADLIINLPKLKTHGLTILTLAVKNLFGCLNGMQKARVHRDCPERSAFAETVVRIAAAARSALTIIDGIVAMEGNGPSAGELVSLNLVVAGTDIHAVDAACCHLVRLDPEELDTLAAARRLKLWDGAMPEMIGDPADAILPQRFALPATYVRGMRDWWISRLVLKWIWSGATAKPRIDPARCERCLLCVEGCPVAAIPRPAEGDAPIIQDKACIQCFCCHELCPHRAIDLRRSAGVKLAAWIGTRRAERRPHEETHRRGDR